MTNYEDIYMKKGTNIIKLRIIFEKDVTADKEYVWDGKKFRSEKDVDFDARYNELLKDGYKEAWMSRDYYGTAHFEEV